MAFLAVLWLGLLPASRSWAADCNSNGVVDAVEVAEGTSPDCNGNSIPDTCDATGDFDGDERVSLGDYSGFHACATPPCSNCPPPSYSDPCCVLADFDADGDVDVRDYAELQIAIGSNIIDCNLNGIDDQYELVSGTGIDCNVDGILDACQAVVFVDDSATNGFNDGSSWDNAFVYLQDALTEAEARCEVSEIWVAEGTYKPDQGVGFTPGFQFASFELQDGLALYGGFGGWESSLDERDIASHMSILDGDLLGDDTAIACEQDFPDCGDQPGTSGRCIENQCDFKTARFDNSYSVVHSDRVDSTARLDGFTVTAGLGDFGGPSITGYVGGGLMNRSGGEPVVANCRFTGNSLAAVVNTYGNPQYLNCTFDRNMGRAMVTEGGSPLVAGCKFIRNLSGAMLNVEQSSPILVNCVFNGNMVYPRYLESQGLRSRGNTSGGQRLGDVGDRSAAAILNENSSPLILNCTFANNEASIAGGAILTIGSTDFPVIKNCVFWGNEPDQIRLRGGLLHVSNSIVQGGWPGGVGILDVDPMFADADGADGDAGNEDDDLRLLPGSPGIDAGSNGAVPIGIETDHAFNLRFSNDINTVDTGTGSAPIVDLGAFEFQSGSLLFVDADAVTGANDGSSWGDAYLTLQDALLHAATTPVVTQVWVAGGTYKPDQGGGQAPGDRASTFQLQSGLAIYGGFAGTESTLDQRDLTTNGTILSGDLLGDDLPDFVNMTENSQHVVTGSGTDATAVLERFTITGGYAYSGVSGTPGSGILNEAGNPTLTDCQLLGNRAVLGSAMANFGSSPTLTRCVFEGNKAFGSGMAMYNAQQSNPSIVDCVFRNSEADQAVTHTNFGGGIWNIDSSPTLSGCQFTHQFPSSGIELFGIRNEASSPVITDCIFFEAATGIWNGNSDPLVDKCRFVGNNQTAMVNHDSEPTITNCSFVQNSRGGIFNSSSDAIVANCLFSGNCGIAFEASISNQFSSPLIINCTVIASINTFDGAPDAGIKNFFNSNPMITNCVLWDQGQTQITSSGGSAPVVNYSIVQGGWSGAGGVGIVDADPLFVDSNGPDDIPGTEDDDLRLRSGSPGVDAGDNSAVPMGVLTDLDGNLRFANDLSTPDTGVGSAPIVDMGAYELPGKSVRFVDANALGGANNGSSWSDAFVHLQDALLDASTNGSVSEIWVAVGMYKPDQGIGQTPGDRHATFQLQDNLAIYGGFDGTEAELEQRDWELNPTILSGDLLGDDLPGFGNNGDNSFHVVTGSNVDDTALIDGFTIESGVAVATFGSINGGGGGVLAIIGDPTVSNCVFVKHSGDAVHALVSRSRFTNCQFVDNGRGLFDESSLLMIDGCSFIGNKPGVISKSSYSMISNTHFENNQMLGIFSIGGGAVSCESTFITISNSKFIRNQATLGGAVSNWYNCDLTFSNCLFRDNTSSQSGGAVHNIGSNVSFRNCRFFVNSANTGGAVQLSGYGEHEILNSVFSGNLADSGGAIHEEFESRFRMNNCTLRGNRAGTAGGGVFFAGSTNPRELTNCILRANIPNQIESTSNAPQINYSIVGGGWSGAGVGYFDADPLFVDSNGADNILGTEDDDLRLMPGSPAIDAGDSNAVPVDVTIDLDGHARFVDDPTTVDTGVGAFPIVDIGAYEFVLGDCDVDGDADLDDHAILGSCLMNPRDALGAGCACLDLDIDGDVDLRDFGFFQMAFAP